MLKLEIKEVQDQEVTVTWNSLKDKAVYYVYWADYNHDTMIYKLMDKTVETEYTLKKSTHVPHYIKIAMVDDQGQELIVSDVINTPVHRQFNEQLEALNRGLIAAKCPDGIFLSWRLMRDEVSGYSETGLTGYDFIIYKNRERYARITDSTNFIDPKGSGDDQYAVAPVFEGQEGEVCKEVHSFISASNYIDIPMMTPEAGVTPKGEAYHYTINDMSVGDVDGDGEYEYIVKWDPSNSHDVSIKGYTGKCFIDCYKLDGRLLWRLDMGVNIRAGAHYTQFMVYDFDGDGKAEMSVKTAPGTKMTRYHKDGRVASVDYITLAKSDIDQGVTHDDNYVCSAKGYQNHLTQIFMKWHEHSEVIAGRWPKNLETCFGIPTRYSYPLNREDARALVDYFIYEYAPSRSEKNHLEAFEGFIYEGPEYLTMFAGNGQELETIPFKFDRKDDGLMWGDYAMARIEPCNRVDRFLSGVAYLDGENPYLIVARGYYTRTTLVAYRFKDGRHREHFSIDSGHVLMDNPFNDQAHLHKGSDPIYGKLAGQGNHSLATADVDGDGYQEIIYGAAVIDHDGSLLYSSYGHLPNGQEAKLGHGDAMHVANINPDKPGLEIFSVFEGAEHAPYGFALRDAETGEVIFGEYAETDLGRCMIGDIDPKTPGLQVWVRETFDCHGNPLDVPLLGTNQSIRWSGDLTTQILDGVDYVHETHSGVIHDNEHGVLLQPEGMATNNGSKGNPCLIADLFGDFREELVLRKDDNSGVRIYTNTELTQHKLYTLMHDIQYRTGIAWQNNCYNQPCYTKFYYASDMDWKNVFERKG
jgi:hypothetical protein